MTRFLRIVPLVALALLAACAPGGDEAPPTEAATPQRVESPSLGIALASVPAPFELVTHQGSDLELTAPSKAGTQGHLAFATGPITNAGINLIEEVKARKEAFEAAPEGVYHGNVELGSPIGTAFTSRGSYVDESGERVEEAWIYALHPVNNQVLNLVFTYPPGEWQERVQQLLAVLGEVEGLGGGGGGGEGEDGGAS